MNKLLQEFEELNMCTLTWQSDLVLNQVRRLVYQIHLKLGSRVKHKG